MKNLVIYTHPNPRSFNHAILEAYKEATERQGHEIKVRDLYALGFDSVLKADDFIAFQKGAVPADIKEEQDLITWADTITFIYPIWWFQMPAILKGYIDRVFSRGFAYDFADDAIKGLLTGKEVILLNTTGGPEESYTNGGFRDALQKTHEIGTFALCGMTIRLHKFFYAVPFVTDDDRKKMLEDMRICLKEQKV